MNKNDSLDIELFLLISDNNNGKKYDLKKKILGHHPKITNFLYRTTMATETSNRLIKLG